MTAFRATEVPGRSRRKVVWFVLPAAILLGGVLYLCAGPRCLKTVSERTGNCIADRVAQASFLGSSLEKMLQALPDVAAIHFVGSADFPLLTDEGVSRCVLRVAAGEQSSGQQSTSPAATGTVETTSVTLLFVVSRNKVFPGTLMTKAVIDGLAAVSGSTRPTLRSLLRDFPIRSWSAQQTACAPSVLDARSLDSWPSPSQAE